MNRSTHKHEPSDAELVRQVQGGAAGAFAELVSRYQDKVYGTCYRLCHNHADALDYTQGAFVQAWEALDRYEGRAGFYTWIFRIAVNVVLSARRRRRRRPEVPFDESGEGSAPAAQHPSTPAGRLERSELQTHLVAALDRLDDEFRAAVILKDVEDMDYATIAEVLDVPVGTVKSRIHRGRLMLRTWLEEMRIESDRARTRQP